MKTMLDWNPLFNVSISASKITFRDERGSFDLFIPPHWENWGVINSLVDGLDPAELSSASKTECGLVDILSRKRLVISTQDSDVENWDRNIGHFSALTDTPLKALEQVRSSTVCILGLGGIGSVVLQHLVGIGVCNYVLVDYDSVDQSNLNRQFTFSAHDIGRSKIEAASDFIKSRIATANISAYATRIESEITLRSMPLKKCDLIVHCMDSPAGLIDEIIYGFAESAALPTLSAGVGTRFGHWGPLICHHLNGVSYKDWRAACSLPKIERPSKESSIPARWSFGPANTIIAANLALDVVEWLAGCRSVRSLNARLVHEFAASRTVSYGLNDRLCEGGSHGL